MVFPTGKNKWFEHPDGHPDAGMPDIPEHHSGGHVYSINSKGEELLKNYGKINSIPIS